MLFISSFLHLYLLFSRPKKTELFCCSLEQSVSIGSENENSLIGITGSDLRNSLLNIVHTTDFYILKISKKSFVHIHFKTEHDAGIFYRQVQNKPIPVYKVQNDQTNNQNNPQPKSTGKLQLKSTSKFRQASSNSSLQASSASKFCSSQTTSISSTVVPNSNSDKIYTLNLHINKSHEDDDIFVIVIPKNKKNGSEEKMNPTTTISEYFPSVPDSE
ncbi:9485_t:CDS:2, partial [Cetraspora pellucida]